MKSIFLAVLPLLFGGGVAAEEGFVPPRDALVVTIPVGSVMTSVDRGVERLVVCARPDARVVPCYRKVSEEGAATLNPSLALFPQEYAEILRGERVSGAALRPCGTDFVLFIDP